jgi:hypothetical protein
MEIIKKVFHPTLRTYTFFLYFLNENSVQSDERESDSVTRLFVKYTYFFVPTSQFLDFYYSHVEVKC